MAKQKDQPGNRPDDDTAGGEILQRRLDRRKFVRAGLAVGAGLVASAYVKPNLQSIGIPRAFAQGTPAPGGKPSIEFRPNDVDGSDGDVDSFLFEGILLCNVSGHHVVTISDWLFDVEIIKGSSLLEDVDVPTSAEIGPLTSPQPGANGPIEEDCTGFPVTFDLDDDWKDAPVGTEIKVRIFATGIANDGQVATTLLTLTLTKV